MKKTFLALGASIMFTGVAFGAFGAHALKGHMAPGGEEIWRTATIYHLIHGIAILFVALLPDAKWTRLAGWLFAYGVLIFAGSLYGLAILGAKWLGAITPLGGLCFLAGWAVLTVKSTSVLGS